MRWTPLAEDGHVVAGGRVERGDAEPGRDWRQSWVATVPEPETMTSWPPVMVADA
jgi:hypothetical protein